MQRRKGADMDTRGVLKARSFVISDTPWSKHLRMMGRGEDNSIYTSLDISFSQSE